MPQESGNQNCVFCLIASEKIEGYKISEIEEAIAVLEINPASKGHTMVLPKEHLQLKEMKSKIILFAQKLASQLKEKLNSKDIEIATVDFREHGIINLIPVYNDESISSERYKASPEELQEVQKLFLEKDEIKKHESEKPEKETKTKKQEEKKEKQEKYSELKMCGDEESVIEKKNADENSKNSGDSLEKLEAEDKPKEPEKEKSIWFPRRIP